jgi:GNAT superfamily N-acetyltransferase
MAERHRLTTARLTMLAATLELLEAERSGPEMLARGLGAAVPGEWPPESRSPEIVTRALARVPTDGTLSGWTSWYLVADDLAGDGGRERQEPAGPEAGLPARPPSELVEGGTGPAPAADGGRAAPGPPRAESAAAPPERVLVGLAGFDGRPSASGEVTIDVAILPSFRRRSFATEAAATLLDWAFIHRTVQELRARVDPEAAGAARLLAKLGFVASDRSLYTLARATHEAARLKKLAEAHRTREAGA